MGNCQSPWHPSSHRTISSRICSLSPGDNSIKSGHRAVWIMCGNLSFHSHRSSYLYCLQAICSKSCISASWTKQIWLPPPPHLYKLITSILRPAEEDKAAAPTIDLEWKWFCTSSWCVTISQCHLQLGPPLRSHVCSCAGHERALNTDCERSKLRDGFHLHLLDFLL